jgi:hypothetical protein
LLMFCLPSGDVPSRGGQAAGTQTLALSAAADDVTEQKQFNKNIFKNQCFSKIFCIKKKPS